MSKWLNQAEKMAVGFVKIEGGSKKTAEIINFHNGD